MTINRRIKRFIVETAKLAVQECPDLTMEQCITEYESQILENDYYSVVNWANWKGIKIPIRLRKVIDPNF